MYSFPDLFENVFYNLSVPISRLVTVKEPEGCIVASEYVILTCVKQTTQTNCNDYGTVREGPVPLQDDEATVSVEELPELLSEVERSTARDLILHQDHFTDDWMIHSFSVAKLFVHELCEHSS